MDGKQTIPERIKIDYSIPLTPEQAEFAEVNHNLIYAYLRKWGLPVDDYYGLAAIGLVKATQAWFQSEYVRKFKFSTIALQAMSGEYMHNKQSKKRSRIIEVEMDEFIKNNLFRTGGQDEINRIIDSEVAEQRLAELRDEHRTILICHCNGLTQCQIARLTGHTQAHISRQLKRIQKILDRRNKDEMSRLQQVRII